MLIILKKPRTGELVVNPTFAAFARHLVFTAKACCIQVEGTDCGAPYPPDSECPVWIQCW